MSARVGDEWFLPVAHYIDEEEWGKLLRRSGEQFGALCFLKSQRFRVLDSEQRSHGSDRKFLSALTFSVWSRPAPLRPPSIRFVLIRRFHDTGSLYRLLFFVWSQSMRWDTRVSSFTDQYVYLNANRRLCCLQADTNKWSPWTPRYKNFIVKI